MPPLRPDGTPTPNGPGLFERMHDNLRQWQQRGNRPAQAPGNGRPEQLSLGDQATEFFRSMGWTAHQAAGLVANLQHESGFDRGAVGDGGRSFGIAQWNGSRRAALGEFVSGLRQQPTRPEDSTFQEQLRFVHHELTQGAEQAAGRILRATTTAQAAGAAVSRHYERPRDEAAEAFGRGGTADAWFQRIAPGVPPTAVAPSVAAAPTGGAFGTGVTLNQRTEINLPPGAGSGSVADTIAREQARLNAELVRNMQRAVQ